VSGPLPVRWFDNHCHLSTGDDGSPVEAAPVVDAAVAAGVEAMITVGTDAEQSARALAVAAAHPGRVWATAGLHPHDAVNGWDWLEPLLSAPSAAAGGAPGARPVAVGECGLDYHYDHSPREVQREAFAAQIGLAHRHGLPLVIHTRAAWDDTFALLDELGTPARTVFHCFTGGAAEAQACLDRGALLSFSGIVTFKGADDVRAAAALCPLDRLVVETDSPYLAPVPHRGQRNQPAWVAAVGAGVAAAKGLAVEAVAEASWDNACRFFAVRPPLGERTG